VSDLFVVHQNGAKQHYLGLEKYCNSNNIKITWLEMDLFRQFALVLLMKKDLNVLIKNLVGLVSLVTRKHMNAQIVLGIAPFSYYVLLLPLIKSKRVYLHTSWPHWSGDFVPFSTKICRQLWDCFLPNYLHGAFCVTEACRDSFVERYPLFKNRSFVVYHAIENFWFNNQSYSECVFDFVYVGRMVREKGVEDILKLASILPNKSFVLVGNGPDLQNLKNKSSPNITFLGRMGRNELKGIYNSSSALLLPSKTSFNWVEAFGIVILEATICGCEVITSDHPGPKELSTIIPSISILNEKHFVEQVLSLERVNFDTINTAKLVDCFSIDNISLRWKRGLSLDD